MAELPRRLKNIGLSRPRACLMESTYSLGAPGRIVARIGSPGIILRMRKTRLTRIKSIGMVSRIRVIYKPVKMT